MSEFKYHIIGKTKYKKILGMTSHFWLEKNIKTKGSLMID